MDRPVDLSIIFALPKNKICSKSLYNPGQNYLAKSAQTSYATGAVVRLSRCSLLSRHKPGQLAVAFCVKDSVAYNASSGLCSRFFSCPENSANSETTCPPRGYSKL